MTQRVLAGVGGYRGARAAFMKRSPRPPISILSPLNPNLSITKTDCFAVRFCYLSNLLFKQVYLSPMREFDTIVFATSARPTRITILRARVTAV